MPLPNEILEQIPEDLRESETLERFNNIGDLAKSYLEQRSLVGQSIRIPSAEAGEEARAEFLEKLINNAPELMVKPSPENPEQTEEFYRVIGKPDDFSKYENPENISLNEDVEAELRQILHQANLTNAQYQKVVAAMAERDQEAQASFKEAREQQASELKAKWGQTHEDRIKQARRANEEFYPGRDFDSLTATEIEGLYNVSAAVTGAGPQAANQPKEGSDALPPDEALRRAAEIMNNPEYWDQSNPNQQHLIKQRLKYLEMAGGTSDMSAHRARSFGE
jgi:hypothetical protein